MKIIILSVGKKHDELVRSMVQEYEKRIGHYVELSWIFVSGQITDSKNAHEGVEKEGKEILNKLESTDRVILLDEIGREWSTMDLAEALESFQTQSIKRLVFVIGGAYGVSRVVRERAQYTWSLSKLTFPHMLVRIILTEQLYRAFSILNGSKYHHE